MPRIPICSKPVLTSSSVNGLTIAVISFISCLLAGAGHAQCRARSDTSEIVSGLSVFSLIDPEFLVFRFRAEAEDELHDEGDDQCDGERIEHHRERADRLHAELVPATAIEQALGTDTGHRSR